MARDIRPPGLTRRPEWPKLLNAYIEDHRHRRFVWGSHDCGTFLGNWVVVATGFDPIKAVRGRYTSARGWQRIRIRDGWSDAAHVFTDAFGKTIELNFAQRGDGVAVQTEDGPAMGILLGDQIAAVGMDRLMFLPVGRAYLAWRI